jgi:2-oxoisovalerate dehydrogenase E1 component alpha subunit
MTRDRARPGDVDLQVLRRVYRVVLTTRAVDERLWILARQGRAGFVLTGRGHEVAQVGTAAALRQGVDSAWPYYRDIGVGLALGVTPYEVFLGALARADDPHSGGRQLTAHLSSPRLRIGSVSSEVAANLPHAVGAAYASWVRDDGAVAMCWFGDGAVSEGATHEAMNLAGVHRLPVVFVCEDNGYAISVPHDLQLAAPVVARAGTYGMAGEEVDGTDAVAVVTAATAAVARARAGDGPTLLSCRVPRIVPHSSQDDDAYRDTTEVEAAATDDPIPKLRAVLIEHGALTETDDAALVAQVRSAVTTDADRALARSEPDPARARRWLFAGDPPHEYGAELDDGPAPAGVFADG